MIRIFPSKFTVDVEPIETNRIHPAGRTIDVWMRENVSTYQPMETPPICVSVNGFYIEPELWADVVIHDSDDVVICPEPKADYLIYVYYFISVGMLVYSMTIQGEVAGQAPKARQDSAAGSKLNLANAKGNAARLNNVLREIAGKHRVYPDYLMPPHRYFTAGNPREQWIEMLLCIGVGYYDLAEADIKIGETPIASLGSDAVYTVYAPSASVAADNASDWWQPCPEVGSSSGGSAGLEITSTYGVDTSPDASIYTFSGDDITIPNGAGHFPDGWEANMLVRVEQPLPYMVQNASPRDIIGGNADTDHWLEQLEPTVGMELEIVGQYNAGDYVIEAYTPYSAGVTGSPSTVEGASSPARYDFGVTPLTFYVERGVYTWQVTLNATSSDVEGVIAEINAEFALRNAPFEATADSSDIITIAETSPYTGTAVTLSGDWDDVFGSTTTDTTGTATEGDTHAQITLSYANGDPVANMETGIVTMAIGLPNMLYKITGVTEDSSGISAISVDRLDGDGNVMSWGGFYTRTMTNCVVALDSSTATGGWTGPFAACPEGEVTGEIELDFFLPNGLMHIDKNDGPEGWTVAIEIQYRDAALGGAWSSVTKTYTSCTQDQLGFTEKITIASYRPEVQVRKTRGDSSSINVADTIVWYGLKAKLDAPTSYEDVTTIAVKVRGGNRLAAQSENLISVEPTRKLPLLSVDSNGDAVWSALTATQDIVPWFCYVAKSVGYTDDDLDLDALVELDGVWQARGDEYNASIDAAETLKAELMDCLQAGSAELTIKRGLLSPVRDQARTTFEQMYSYQNMSKALSRQFSAIKPDDFDGIDVEYTNGTSWQKETVQCRALTDEGTRVEKIKAVGVTSRTQAWRLGMRRRLSQLLRRWKYDFETEMEGMNSNYLSYVSLAEDLPGYSTSAQLTGYDEASSDYSVLHSSEPMVFGDGEHMIAVRKLDGTLDGPWVCTSVSANSVAIADTLSFTPNFDGTVEYPHIIFGPTNTYQYPALVTTINPQDKGRCQVEAINYDADVYAYDEAEPFDNSFMVVTHCRLDTTALQLASVRVELTNPTTENAGCTLTNDHLFQDASANSFGAYSSCLAMKGYANIDYRVDHYTAQNWTRKFDVSVFVADTVNGAKTNVAARTPIIPMFYDKASGWFYGLNATTAPYYFYKARTADFIGATQLLGYANAASSGMVAYDDIKRMVLFRAGTEYLWYLSAADFITRMNTNQAFNGNGTGRKTDIKTIVGDGAVNYCICSLGRDDRLIVGDTAGGVNGIYLIDLTSAGGTLLDSTSFAGGAGVNYVGISSLYQGMTKWIGGGRFHPMLGWNDTADEMYLDVFYVGEDDNIIHTVKNKRIMPTLVNGGVNGTPLWNARFIKF